jgi:hypothetical protein
VYSRQPRVGKEMANGHVTAAVGELPQSSRPHVVPSWGLWQEGDEGSFGPNQGGDMAPKLREMAEASKEMRRFDILLQSASEPLLILGVRSRAVASPTLSDVSLVSANPAAVRRFGKVMLSEWSTLGPVLAGDATARWERALDVVLRVGHTLFSTRVVTERSQRLFEHVTIRLNLLGKASQGSDLHVLAAIGDCQRSSVSPHGDGRGEARRLRQMLHGLLEAVTRSVGVHFPTVARHQKRVSLLARGLGATLGLQPHAVDALRFAGAIHDIGMLGLPPGILESKATLSACELRLMMSHARRGAEILECIDFPWPVSCIVDQHHERWDGSGYPDGLVGSQIAIEARVLAVADVVEAMVSARPHRPPCGLGAALDELAHARGAKYDPDVVDACLHLLTKGGFAW